MYCPKCKQYRHSNASDLVCPRCRIDTPQTSNGRSDVASDFVLSAAIGFATDSALIGGLLGGDLTGGIVGDLLNGGELFD
jgi:hypothetical protein